MTITQVLPTALPQRVNLAGARGQRLIAPRGVAAGVYTDIVEIVAPDNALPGDRVDITVRIKNTYSSTIGIMVGGALEYGVTPWPNISFPDDVANVPAGQVWDFNGYFYMPDSDVTIHAYSYYYATDGYWYFDDEATTKVVIAGWQLLDWEFLTIAPVVTAWQVLDTRYSTVKMAPPEVGWNLLDSSLVTVKVAPPTAGWNLLDEITLVVKLGPPTEGWQALDEAMATVKVGPPAAGWEMLDFTTVAITTGPPVEVWELIQDTIYHWAYIYEGDGEYCNFEFKLTPEQIPGTPWIGKKIADTFASELEKQGAKLLTLKVWEDTTPALWTNYRVGITAIFPETPETARRVAVAMPFPWTVVIIAVLAILFIVSITFMIREIDKVFFKRYPLDEETKKTFERETLIAMILDLDPDIPPESLEPKTDQELRDLVNQLLEEKKPPVSWWPFAVAAGVLGVGAAAVAATRKKKPAETVRSR